MADDHRVDGRIVGARQAGREDTRDNVRNIGLVVVSAVPANL
jgi:hypothetical protein